RPLHDVDRAPLARDDPDQGTSSQPVEVEKRTAVREAAAREHGVAALAGEWRRPQVTRALLQLRARGPLHHHLADAEARDLHHGDRRPLADDPAQRRLTEGEWGAERAFERGLRPSVLENGRAEEVDGEAEDEEAEDGQASPTDSQHVGARELAAGRRDGRWALVVDHDRDVAATGCGGVLGNSSVGVGLGARGAEARHGTAGPVGARLRTLLARALSTGPIATATPPSPRSSGRTSHPALPTSAPKAWVTRFPLPDLTAPATGPR